MNAQQKRLIVPMAILALGLVALVGAAYFILASGGQQARGSAIGGPFTLTDQNGARVTDATYRGAPSIVFFGYTHCPDVCPTTMAELSQALQQLGPEDAKRVQVLFVTVDPERDTPELMAQYVPAFNPTFVGLRPADQEQLTKVTKDFRVYYAKVPGKTPDSYTMDHTAASYVFDTDGKLRLFARDGQGASPWVHDLKLLLG